MLLKKLIKNLSPKIGSLEIRGISNDSRKVKKGDLFVAIKGEKEDGNKYISHAISKGAKAVVYSGKIKKNKKDKVHKFQRYQKYFSQIKFKLL